MSEDTKQPEPKNDPQAKSRLYYRRLLIIAFITLIISGIWCLLPFWKEIFSGNSRFPGFYWLFVAESGPVFFRILLFLLGGIGLFCFSHFFRTLHPEEPRHKLMSLNELRDLIGLLGAAIGLAMVFRLGMRSLLLDFFAMENIGSIAAEEHIYHLAFYNTGAFSDGMPYGLIECDALDLFCNQIEAMFVVERREGYGPEQPTVEYDDATGIPYIIVTDDDYHWGPHPLLRYDDITHTLYVERNDQTYYSYQLEE